MDQEGIFKTTTFGGFDKKAVLTYIDALTEKHHAQEEELRGQIVEFSKAQDSQVEYIQKLEDQLETLEDKLDVLAEQLESERAATPHAASEINDLNQENQELAHKLAEAEKELSIQQERNRQLQFKVEGVVYKSQKYDELSSQVGEAMLSAKASADKILQDAQNEAKRLLEEARQTAKETLSAAEHDATETLIDAQGKADALEQQSEAQAQATVAQAQAQANAITKATKTEIDRFGGEVGSFRGDTSRLRKSIEEILFVLNDRVDVMQEIVRQMEAHSAQLSEQVPVAEPMLFEKAEDEAGYFGGTV